MTPQKRSSEWAGLVRTPFAVEPIKYAAHFRVFRPGGSKSDFSCQPDKISLVVEDTVDQ
jgi:hypothetical protein